MEAEGQRIAFYIVFDHRKQMKLPQALLDGKLQNQKGVYQIKTEDGKEIYLIHININK